jgi:DHA1 family bicyclomycin/chloramphenicol resistance-like MFS transporter
VNDSAVPVAAPLAEPGAERIGTESAAARRLTKRRERLLLGALGLLSMIAPFATDMYLPAFPELASDLAVTPSIVQLTLTVFLVGLAFGQLIFGPLSDRLGRKPPLIAGALVCTVASAAAALAPTAELLLGARFVQGLSGAAGVVIARAVVSDVFHGPRAAGVYSLLGVIVGIAPVVAPLVGGLLAQPLGWRGLLWVLAALTGAMLVAAIALPETAPRGRHPEPSSRSSAQGPPFAATPRPRARAVLLRKGFLGHAFIVMFAFMALMAYISASPFVFQELMGLDERGSGLLFALNSVALITSSTVNARIVPHRGPRRMLRLGLSILTLAVATLAVLVLFGAPARTLGIPLFVLVGSMGLVFGNAVALAIEHARSVAGTASAVIGFGQFVGGAAVAPVVGLRPDAVATLLVVVTGAAATLAWTAYASARPSRHS